MRTKNISAFTACILFLLFLTGKAQAQADINFSRLEVKQGLSQNTIFSILQDHRGFMWFATHDGLNKYDGYTFTVYKNINGDSTSIPDNIIYSVCQSKFTHKLWIGTNSSGLCCFDYDSEVFTGYKPDPNDTLHSLVENTVKNIVEDENGLLWINYDRMGGISCFNPETGSAKNFYFNPMDPGESGYGDIYIYLDSRHYLWACTKKGLYRFDKNTETFTSYKHNEKDGNSIPNDLINSIYEDADYTFWISSEEGLIKFSPDNNNFTLFQHDENNPFSISENHAYICLRDVNKRLWIGTRNGLNQYLDSANHFLAYKNNPANLSSLSSNNISKLFLDEAGVLWIGTFENGINKFDTQHKEFVQHKYTQNSSEQSTNNTLRAIYEDRHKTLWLGFVNGGLLSYNRKQNRYTPYRISPGTSYEFEPTVTSICEDYEGALWVGTWENGIVKIEFRESGKELVVKSLKNYTYNQTDPFGISNSTIQFIFQDSARRLWIGTSGGIDIYDRENDRFKHLTSELDNQNSLSNFSIQNAIAEAKGSVFWVGTWYGLNKITLLPEFDTKFASAGANINSLVSFEHFFHNPQDTSSLSDNRITSVCINNASSLWVGLYGGGLNKINFHEDGTHTITTINEENGLSNNVVYCIYKDENGSTWCSTNNGISEIKQESGQILQYHESDGLLSNDFFWGAGYKSRSGEIFFGGNGGFTSFFPSKIHENDYKVPIVLTKLEVFNQTIKPDGIILKENISEAKEIFLNWRDKVFSIEFSALHFSSPENISYKYMLKGFDKDWVPTDYRNRMATYTNLDPGRYEFYVIASNSDGIYNEDYHSITIHIKPPFWKTLWFRISFLVLISGIVYLIFILQIRKIKEQKRKLEIQVKERTDHIEQQKEEIRSQNEMIILKNHELTQQNTNKEKLISILSHDLRSPVVTMISMLENFVDNWDIFDDEKKIYMVNILKKDTETNLNLIDDALAFVKMSWNKIVPHISNKALETTLNQVVQINQKAALLKDLELIISGKSDILVSTDHEIVKHILMNFVSNAIKFTPKAKRIEILTENLGEEIWICVRDQGIGIPQDKLKGLFDGLDGYSRSGTEGEKSHGIGLQLVKQYAETIGARIEVQSKVNKGSSFCLIIPKEQKG